MEQLLSPQLLTPLYGTIFLVVAFMAVGRLLDALCGVVTGLVAGVLGDVVYWGWGTVFLPGTVMHELAHALFIACTGGRVTQIVVREDSRHPWVLYSARGRAPSSRVCPGGVGHVSYVLRGPYVAKSIQRVLGSIAPTVVGVVCMGALVGVLRDGLDAWWQVALVVYLLLCALAGSTLSSVDVEEMLPGLPVCLVLVYVVLLASGFDPLGAFLSWARLDEVLSGLLMWLPPSCAPMPHGAAAGAWLAGLR